MSDTKELLIAAQISGNSTRFAYVPVGARFRFGRSGTTDYTKVNQDEAIGVRDLSFTFDLNDLCYIADAPPALTPKQEAAEEMYEALENCAELLNVAMERLGVCGEGDGGQRRADAEFPGGVAALHAARAALAKAGRA